MLICALLFIKQTCLELSLFIPLILLTHMSIQDNTRAHQSAGCRKLEPLNTSSCYSLFTSKHHLLFSLVTVSMLNPTVGIVEKLTQDTFPNLRYESTWVFPELSRPSSTSFRGGFLRQGQKLDKKSVIFECYLCHSSKRCKTGMCFL